MSKENRLDEQLGRLMSVGDTAKVVMKHSLRIDVAVQISMLREEKGWTQRQLASKAGVPQSTVARVESGSFGVGLGTLEKFLSVLDAAIKIVKKTSEMNTMDRKFADKVQEKSARLSVCGVG